jgi:folate-binding protein YgfZ
MTIEQDIIARLPHLGLIRLTGKDAQSFLAGQLTSDVKLVSPTLSQLTAWCNPKGRVLTTFRLFQFQDAYYLQLPAELLDSMLQRLKKFVLRSDVAISDASTVLVCIGLAGPGIQNKMAAYFKDIPAATDQVCFGPVHVVIRVPGRHPRFLLVCIPEFAQGIEQKLSEETAAANHPETWRLLDILPGVPSIYPATSESFLPQMLNLEELGALSFSKGCYPGQEVIARLKYRGELKRRMYLALSQSEQIPAPGEPLFAQGSEATEAIGHVVMAAAHPSGGSALLAVIQIETVAAGIAIAVGSPDGPLVAIQSGFESRT